MKAHLVINGRLAGLNEYTASCRTVKGKYFKGNTIKHLEQQKVCKAIREQLNGVHFEHPVHVDFRWYEKDKKRDMDNIAFAKKFIFDALVEEHVIDTDNWRGVKGFKDYFFVDKDNPRVVVTIYRV